MTLIEILLLIVYFSLLILFLSNKTMNKKIYLSTIIGIYILLILHIVLDIIRWQYYPFYLLLGIFACFFFFERFKEVTFNRLFRRITSIFLSILFVLSTAVLFVFPVYKIPLPSGDYLIGTESFILEDESRTEEYGENEHRRFKIQIWYPAQTTNGYEQAPWLEGGKPLSMALAKDNWLPAFALNHTTNVMSNSYYNAPINIDSNTYPIVVVSHGWRGFSTLHTDLIEELASNGYIVVSIDHTYGSVATVFDEDDVSYLNLDALPPRDTNPNFLDDANQLVSTYAGDILNTLHFLEELNIDSESSFYTKLDLENIGLLGHSTGGGAGVDVALNDVRIDAVLGLDSWVEPIGTDDLSSGLSMPSLFLRSESWETGLNNEYLYTVMNESSSSSLYQINGTTHYDFAMVYMYSPLVKTIGFTGSIDSEYLTNMLKTIMTDFFDENLKGTTSSTIDFDQWNEINKVLIP